jgi:hypothetical protein
MEPTQNYWVSGLCPSSGILETTKHNVSETGRFRPQVRRETPTQCQLGLLELTSITGQPPSNLLWNLILHRQYRPTLRSCVYLRPVIVSPAL